MKGKTLQLVTMVLCIVISLAANGWAQVNTGSDGSDGAFNATTSTNINMGDHPNGIYQYTSVNISSNVTVTFTPNAGNTPVIWLVQSNIVINGTVDVSGQPGNCGAVGGAGGPGGYRGGNSGPNATSGQGPGGVVQEKTSGELDPMAASAIPTVACRRGQAMATDF